MPTNKKLPLISARTGCVLLGLVLGAPGPASHAQTASVEPVEPAAPAAPATPAAVAPASRVLSSAEGDYVLVSGDTVEVTIFREPDLASRSTIARDGTVQLPLLREVSLADMTVRDARTLLTNLYGEKYLVNPQVQVDVVSFAKRTFTIMGQVAKPGSYQLEGGQRLDLLEAIGQAGGFTRIADRGRILVRRVDEDGENRVHRLNAKRMADGKAESFEILPGDVITVGESWF